MKRSPIRRRPRTKRRELQTQEDRDYLSWVATQPCMACGADGVQVAHVGQGGMGMKHGTDLEVIPLCRPCHEDHDQVKGGFSRPDGHTIHEWRAEMAVWNRHHIATCRSRYLSQ